MSGSFGGYFSSLPDRFTNRSFYPEEYLSVRGRGSFIPEIVDNGLARRLRQRQEVGPPGLPRSNGDSARLPFEIVKAKSDHLYRTKPEVDQATRDGVGTPWRIAILKSSQQLGQLSI